MTARKGGEQSPPDAPSDDAPSTEAFLDMSDSWSLPPPYPPLHDWAKKYMGHLVCPDVDTLLYELSLIAVFILWAKERKPDRVHPKNSKLARDLAKARAAAKVLEKTLPCLISAAKADLDRPVICQDVLDKAPELVRAKEGIRKELAVEASLLLSARRMTRGEGFFGRATDGRHPEPWTQEAVFLFETGRTAMIKARMEPINEAGLHEKSPIVLVIWEALKWIGLGDRAAGTIAQAIKRGVQSPRSSERKGEELEPLARRVIAESVLLYKWNNELS